MSSSFLAQVFLLLLSASQADAISNDQFQRWFSEMDFIGDIVKENCSTEALVAMGHTNPQTHGLDTVSCILDNLSELTKTEMGLCAVILGITPIALQMIGPKVNEISTLALRKPLLAFLMSLGSPCATVDRASNELIDHKESDTPLWPDFLKKKNSWINALIWFLEYGMAGVAAGNSIYLAWQLTFQTVVLISSYLGAYGNTLEAFSPLLWVFTSIPIHAMGIVVLRWYHLPSPDAAQSPGFRPFQILRSWIIREATPCAYLKPVHFEKKRRNRSYIPVILNWCIKLCLWAQTIFGVFIFSSMLFISLWGALRVMSRMICGSLACRLVLAFEMYGAKRIAAWQWDTEPPRPRSSYQKTKHDEEVQISEV